MHSSSICIFLPFACVQPSHVSQCLIYSSKQLTQGQQEHTCWIITISFWIASRSGNQSQTFEKQGCIPSELWKIQNKFVHFMGRQCQTCYLKCACSLWIWFFHCVASRRSKSPVYRTYSFLLYLKLN